MEAGAGHEPPSQDSEGRCRSISTGQTLLFKKRKLLPHPKPKNGAGVAWRSASHGAVPGHDATLEKPSYKPVSGSNSPGPARVPGLALRRQSARLESGPDLPPTPPAHSRNSSSSHSAMPPSPPFVDTPDTSAEDVRMSISSGLSPPRTPKTPTNQRSPPTPDVTPPPIGAPGLLQLRRPPVTERLPSKATTVDSQAESFQTAPEVPYLSEDDDGRSTLRPVRSTVRTSSQSTVRLAEDSSAKTKRKPQTIGLGLGLEASPSTSPESSPLTPRSPIPVRFPDFEGDWSASRQLETTPEPKLTVRKRQARSGTNGSGSRQEVTEKDIVNPTQATEMLRSMCLPERTAVLPSPGKAPRAALEPSPEISMRKEIRQNLEKKQRRTSAASSRSIMSSITSQSSLPDITPRRQRTLRHVRKQEGLRDSTADIFSVNFDDPSLAQTDDYALRRPPPFTGKNLESRHLSYASVSTVNSISSRKARRDVIKNGGIPVVIIPKRRSSMNSASRSPSLRSAKSSARSKCSQSVSSSSRYPPLTQLPHGMDLTWYFDRPTRRDRTRSDADGSEPGDQRTMDFPPVVPMRTSSLSAPTSRQTSRSGSLTAESLRQLEKANNKAAQSTETKPQAPAGPQLEPQKSYDARQDLPSRRPPGRPEARVKTASSTESIKTPRQHPMHKNSMDHHGDQFSGRRLSARNTPFSQYSVETSTTSHAEVSEAQAVNLYPHQNKSILMVDHSTRPSETSDSSLSSRRPPAENPTIKMTDVDAGTGPVTPPQGSYTLDDVDSPLRNPRAPPQPPNTRVIPPAIAFIPATPSGLTPAQEKEKQLGNFYEDVPERPPLPRRMSTVVRRALGRRDSSSADEPLAPETTPRRSKGGILSRTLSLTRNSSLRRRRPDETDRDAFSGRGHGHRVSAPMGPEDEPADDTRLHPFWRPAYATDEDEESDCSSDEYYYDDQEADYRYTDDAKVSPRRTFGQRMKHTFAILPRRQDYYGDDYPKVRSPIRRTVHRSNSGNLRVVNKRASLESISRPPVTLRGRPFTAPDDDDQPRRGVWRSLSRRRSQLPVVVGGGGGRGALPKRRLSLRGPAFDSFSGQGSFLQSLPRRLSLSERRREKRSEELRRTISGPREVRDGVNDVIRRSNTRAH